MTRDPLADLAVCDAATPGPWKESAWTGILLKPDAAFIATARDALPAWIHEAARQRERVGQLEAALVALQLEVARLRSENATLRGLVDDLES